MRIDNQLSENVVLQQLGGRIAQHRLNRNLTQAQLAKEAGVSLSTVNRMESGSSSQIANLVRVLRALEMMENFDLLIPEPAISPLQQLQLEGKTRQRARPKQGAESSASGPWSWDEATTATLENRGKPFDRDRGGGA